MVVGRIGTQELADSVGRRIVILMVKSGIVIVSIRRRCCKIAVQRQSFLKRSVGRTLVGTGYSISSPRSSRICYSPEMSRSVRMMRHESSGKGISVYRELAA